MDMFDKLRLWAKIMAAVGASIGIVGAALTWNNLAGMSRLISEAERMSLDAHFKAISTDIESGSRTAEILSALVANIPLVGERLEASDRAFFNEQFVPGFKQFATDYGVEQFQFHTPPATSFFRVHLPQKYGDDLSPFRFTVLAANRELKPVHGLENGVAGLGMRGIVPVYHDGRHVGSVEFGENIGQPFFDEFKLRNGVDAGLFLLADGSFKAVGSTFGEKPLLAPDVLKKAMNGEPQLGHIELGGAPRAIYAASVADYSGKAIGVIEIAMDSSRYQAELSSARVTASVVGLLSIAFGLGLATMLARHVGRRIDTVVTAVDRVARGDLSAEISLGGRDEIADLARATGVMQGKLRELAAEVGAGAAKVHAAAEEIGVAVERQAATSAELAASMTQISSTMEELTASSTQIASNSKSVADMAGTTLDRSREGTEAIATVLTRMSDIRVDNQRGLREMADLGASAKEIGKVMEIIHAVTDQTKLLAFNAALEASSAGEAGRRFSVVAGEIRRLADSVAGSTREIDGKVNGIQDSISRLTEASEKGADVVDAGVNASAAASERLDAIVQTAGRTAGVAQQISLSTGEQHKASSQVVQALREIASASAHTEQSIGNILRISQEMTELSAQLGELVRQFKLD
jgi:methyl-accepting chemotaxis protein